MVTLTGYFPKKKVDLVVSTVHAHILLLFNATDEMSIEAISKVTKYVRCLSSRVSPLSSLNLDAD